MNEADRQRWLDEAKREALAPWDQKRGIATIDRNAQSVHVRAGVAETAAELAVAAVRWEKDALDRAVWPGAQNVLVFRLRGHPWTVIVSERLYEAVDAQALSRSLQADVIDFSVSDTCGSIGYSFFEKGERTEHFFGSEGEGTTEFESKIRTVPKRARKDIWAFAEQFFLAHDAFEPGLDYEYFFRQDERQATASRIVLAGDDPVDDRPRVRNPGLAINIAGEEVVSKPEFERIDLVVMRDSPNKIGRILLG
jgi:hypothetical protein